MAALTIVAAVLIAVPVALAQNYPSRTVRIIAPAAPGGATDILARILSAKLYESWGQIVQVDNRPGAGGVIGSEIVARAPSDGYTLLMALTTHVTNPVLQVKLPYDTLQDFAPVSMVAVVPAALLVHPSLPVRSVKELVALARARPGELDYGTSGIGTAAHLAALLFSSMTGIRMVHVAYKGGAPAIYDLLGGQISLMFGSTASGAPHVHAGKLHALAVTSPRRSPALPRVPTMVEAGLPDFEAMAWFALLAPARTPGTVINKLNSEVVAVLQRREVAERLKGLGAEVQSSTPGELDDYIRAEIVKWRKVIGGLRFESN
ncbi:MAG: tripartite tricarboxylate transporter substrate binding protein [Betaproteobacteria bacterium]|nr:tripartite tricarboxylate transporter substrate binding protein [Betaproteobacteria bacterium]